MSGRQKSACCQMQTLHIILDFAHSGITTHLALLSCHFIMLAFLCGLVAFGNDILVSKCVIVKSYVSCTIPRALPPAIKVGG